jgi:hypothetical protein
MPTHVGEFDGAEEARLAAEQLEAEDRQGW